MHFELAVFGPYVRQRAQELDLLGLEWTVGPVMDGHDKPSVAAAFEGPVWLSQITAWETGEVDVENVGRTNGRGVTMQYRVGTVADLEAVVDDLLELQRNGKVPPNAFTYEA